MTQVEQQVLANTSHLIDGLSQINGVDIVSRTETERRSGIVSFVSRKKSSDSIYEALQASGIRSSLRNGAIRLSPHFYQGNAEIEVLLSRIEHACYMV
jgi:selenocysteine lyase/cysteine desulfurase